MRHVEPSRWNDVWAGRVSAAERDKLERHAAGCPRCAAERERVTRGSDTFATLRAQSSPELGWDSIRARVHWSVSSERRKSERSNAVAPRRPFALAALGLAGAAAIGTVVVAVAHRDDTETGAPIATTHAHAPDAAPAPIAPAPPAALAGLVDRVAGDVMLDGLRLSDDDLFAKHLIAGDVIATADGRVDVQFGEASAFRVGPRSTLELRRFDAEAIELAVDGTVDVTVAPRAKGQRFVVHAGSRDIEVRGTQFRVTRDATTTRVACRHGLVAVRDNRGQLEVAGERGVTLRNGADVRVADAHATQLAPEELASLVASTPYTLALSTGAEPLARTSAPLAIAGNRRDVRVDGIEHGSAPLRLRVLPGRHTVEAADAAGRFHRIGWVDVTLAAGARLEIPIEAAPVPTTGVRQKQLLAGLRHDRLAKCTRQITKAGMTDTAVDIEITVDANGAINVLNVLDGDLSAMTKSCVHDVVHDVPFGPGPSASWRQRIALP